MVGSANLTVKYLITFGASAFFWIVPVSAKAPRLIVLTSFVASISGFVGCFCMAGSVTEEHELNSMRKVQDRELITYKFGLEEMAAKQLMEAEYFPQYIDEPEAEEEAIVVQSNQQSINGIPQQKQLPDALTDDLKVIIQFAQSSGGAIKQRDAMRKFKCKAEEMQAYFKALQMRGYGHITTDGRTYTFHLTRQSA